MGQQLHTMASVKGEKKKEPKEQKFVWTDKEKMKHGIDPIIWNLWNEKWNASGMDSWTDFYQVPVQHGGPTSLEIAAYCRAKQQWAAEAYDKKREGTRHKNSNHITYPAGRCVISRRMRAASIKDEAARLESPARPRNESLINRDDPEYADLVHTQAEVDLADQFGDLFVADHPDVPVVVPMVDDEDVVVDLESDDEPLAIVDHAFMERSNPAAFMHSPLVLRDRKHCVLMYVAEYEGRMRVKAEQKVEELTAKLEAKTVYKLMTNDGTADDEYNEYVAQLQWENWHMEKELVPSLDVEIEELKKEVTRLNGLFRDVSLLARDALGAICDRFNV